MMTKSMKTRKRSSSRAERFPKTLFALSRCRIVEDDGSGDLLSRSTVHADDRDGVDYSGGATGGRGKALVFCFSLLRRNPHIYMGEELLGLRRTTTDSVSNFHISIRVRFGHITKEKESAK